jgi:hypothetical protein
MSNEEGGRRYVRGTFQQTCGFCGCVFHVEVPGQTGRDAPEHYQCPECDRSFPVKACDPPTTTLISKRTDGLEKQCPDGWEIPRPKTGRTLQPTLSWSKRGTRGLFGKRRGRRALV